MSRIHIIATGGTIAMAQDSTAGGAVLSLSGSDFVQRMMGPETPGLPNLTHEEYGPLPSSHFTVEHLWGLRERVSAAVNDPDVDGVVITHGTDSLEETAYLLDLTVPSDKPMCVTGAMRIASQPGYEGIANLIAAVRAASSTAARGLGALVVLNDEIHSARDVTKMHTQSLATFSSPSWGPIGRVEAERVVITRRVERDIIVCDHLEPRVYLFKLAVGMDADLVQPAIGLGARGIVVETFGGGRVPPWWLDAIKAAMDATVGVAVTTRCPTGRLYDPYRYEGAYHDLQDLGCLFGHELNGQKTRLRLMAALSLASDLHELAEIWYAGTG